MVNQLSQSWPRPVHRGLALVKQAVFERKSEPGLIGRPAVARRDTQEVVTFLHI